MKSTFSRSPLARLTRRARKSRIRRTHKLQFERMEDRRLLASDFVVNTNLDLEDLVDDGIVDVDPNTPGQQLSLREAIKLANGDPNSIILFDLPDDSTIEVGSTGLGPLPAITDRVNVLGPSVDDKTLTLDGQNQNFPAFQINATGALVSGLRIVRFGDPSSSNPSPAILVEGGADNFVTFNEIGALSTDFRFSNNGDGIRIVSSSGNTIRNNRILQNFGDGVVISGVVSRQNALAANVIQFNAGDGVVVENASENIIGGNGEGLVEGNNISRQEGNGVVIRGSFASLNVVQGNVLGLDENLIDELGNFGNGVLIADGAFSNRIGTSGPGFNLISSNELNGVAIIGQSESNRIENNIIGLDGLGTQDPATGFIRRPNGESGVLVLQSPGNTIGGVDISARNVISGNALHGVHILGSAALGNVILHNFIGTDPNNIGRQKNGGHGVLIEDASFNMVGGISPNNFIAGNVGDGVHIKGIDATGNRVQGNIFGASTPFPIANAGEAIAVVNAPANIIGGTSGNDFNEIASGRGILIQGPTATGNVVQGNFIGTDSQQQIFGGFVQGNVSQFGIMLDETSGNIIGGPEIAAANSIANVNGAGIIVQGVLSTDNRVQGNPIGVTADGFNRAPGISLRDGIVIRDGASNNLIGGLTLTEGNVIGFTRDTGITVVSGSRNSLLANLIFGTVGLPIDLGGDGETENDPLDVDAGANQLQNSPTITSVVVNGSATEVEGVLESQANTTYRVEFFANPEFADLAAEIFIGAIDVTTDQDGLGVFTANFDEVATTVTASATDPQGNTSELFSSSLIVNSLGDESDADPNDGTADVDLATPGLQVTLRSALEESQRRFGRDRIYFQIPLDDASDLPIIAPQSALPAITQPLTIDGTTQAGAGIVVLESDTAAFDGLRIEQGASPFEVTVLGFEITGFANGIAVNGRNAGLVVGHVELHDNLDAGLVSFGSVEIVEPSRFNSNGLSGIIMEEGAILQSLPVEFIEASNNGELGFHMAGGALHNVVVTGNSEGGINTRSSDLRLTGSNVISDNFGRGLEAFGAVLEVENLEVLRNSSDGIVAGTIDLILGDNTLNVFRNAGFGIRLAGGAGGILLPDELLGLQSMTIEKNGSGIVQQNSSGTISLANARIENNSGDGVFSLGDVRIFGTGNVISSNDGDGVNSFGNVEIRNAEILRNTGDGINAFGDVTMQSVFVCGNQGEQIRAGGEIDSPDPAVCSSIVTNTNDSGFGSLRDAVKSVQFTLNPTITFDMEALGPGTHTIRLQSQLVSERRIFINGPGSDIVTVDGGNQTRLISIASPEGENLTAEIIGLKLRGGNAGDGDGGAVRAEGAFLRLRDVVLEGNRAERGGAVALLATEIFDDYGGSSSGSAELVIVDSIVRDNEATQGGGLWVEAPLDIQDSTLQGNVATEDGGAIHLRTEPFSISNFLRSTFSDNRAVDGDGGAVAMEGGMGMHVSTFSGNSAGRHGGAIFQADSSGAVLYSHLTVTNNRADSDGDGVGAGGAVANHGSTEVVAKFSILAGNFGGSGVSTDDVSGQLSSSSLSNLIGEDPRLAPLADNGGKTFTHALLDDSPALDAAVGSILLRDQRGFARSVNNDPDLGAYERLLDFGDADANGYPVLLEEDGARHVLTSLRLGATVTDESDGRHFAHAPIDAGEDGDDGVVFHIAASSFSALVEVTSSDAGFLNAWIDFNVDGDWDDAGEQIFTDVAVTQGLNRLTYAVPEVGNIVTFARVRLSSEPGLTPRGLAADGEVEDYQVALDEAILPEITIPEPKAPHFIFTRLLGLLRFGIWDPEVAVGYVYEVNEGPNFEEIELLPGFGDDVFTLGLADGAGGFTDVFTFIAGERINFETDPRLLIPGGVREFRITGIEVDAGLDPSSSVAFPTGIGFVSSGLVTFTQTALTEFVNAAPIAGDDAGETPEDTPLVVTIPGLLTNDDDPDPENTALTVTAVNGVAAAVDNQIALASGALLHVNADGSYTYDPNGAFESLADGETATDSFTYTVSDDHGGSDEALVTITVTGASAPPNQPPVITSLVSSSPECGGAVHDENVSITAIFTDLDAGDTHTATVDWGDGTVTAGTVNQTTDTVTGSHAYNDGGIYSITVTVSDQSDSDHETTDAFVTGVRLTADGVLQIIGTEGRDHVNLKVNEKKDELKVDIKLNQGGSKGGPDGGGDRIKRTFALSSIERIVSYLCGGDDHYNGGSLALSQFVFGGAGNDHIQGGRGNDVLSGGSGNDHIQGGDGHDILIGGTGKDKLHGGRGDDLLIGGSAANEDDLTSVDAALADWTSGDLAGALVDLGAITDDGDKDDLKGEEGMDHLIGGAGDKLKQ